MLMATYTQSFGLCRQKLCVYTASSRSNAFLLESQIRYTRYIDSTKFNPQPLYSLDPTRYHFPVLQSSRLATWLFIIMTSRNLTFAVLVMPGRPCSHLFSCPGVYGFVRNFRLFSVISPKLIFFSEPHCRIANPNLNATRIPLSL